MNELNIQNNKKSQSKVLSPKSSDLMVAWLDTGGSELSPSKPDEFSYRKLDIGKMYAAEALPSNKSTVDLKTCCAPLRRPNSPCQAFSGQQNYSNYANNNQPINLQQLFSKDEGPQLCFQTDPTSTAKIADQLRSKNRTDLIKFKTYMELIVLRGKFSAEAGAKLCISIMEKEEGDTLLESLIKTCEQWYEERDLILRSVKSGTGTRFTDFMRFLTEMCVQLKRAHLEKRSDIAFLLLCVLMKCCQVCAGLPIKYLVEVKCLLFVLASVGRDMEMEFPVQIKHLLTDMKFASSASLVAPEINEILLHLIEMSSSSWELPKCVLQYYNI